MSRNSPLPSVEHSDIPESYKSHSGPNRGTSSDAVIDSDVDSVIKKRNSRILTLLLLATFVVILNEMIMTVAIPKLIVDLHIDALAAQWLSTAFMLTMGVVIPVTGFLLQRFTTRSMFIAAMSLFSFGTLVAAFAPGFSILLVARVIQASGTAIMLPLLITTLMTIVPANKRGRTMGNVSIVISVAPALGPTISGLILTYFDWRWIFFFVFPIAAIMLLIGMKYVENVTTVTKPPIDIISVILSAFGFGGLVYSLSQFGVPHPGGNAVFSIELWVSLAIGVVGLIAFVTRQLSLQKKNRALLDFRTFRSPVFTLCVVIVALGVAVFYGGIIILSIYLQNTLYLDTLTTGLLLLPGGLMMGVLAPFAGRLYDKIGPRPLAILGTIIASIALWALSFVTAQTSPFYVLAAHIVLSIGLTLIFTPLFTAGLAAVPQHLYSHGSAILGTSQQVAGAAGTALLVAVMSAQTIALSNQGENVTESMAGGVAAAFLVAGIFSLLSIVGAFFVRKPAENIPEEKFSH